MLPPKHRVTDPTTFRTTVRTGRRGTSRTLVCHLTVPVDGEAGPARVGFVVGKSVGNSVVRHRVQRRLRHLVRLRLDQLPAGSRLVVRALPPAADASSARLDADLGTALVSALGPALAGARR